MNTLSTASAAFGFERPGRVRVRRSGVDYLDRTVIAVGHRPRRR